MQNGYGKDEIIVKVSADKDSLIGKLLDIDEKASALSSAARSLMQDLHETTTQEGA